MPISVPAITTRLLRDVAGAQAIEGDLDGRVLRWLSARIGQKKSFHDARNVSMPNTAIAGRAIGTTIDRKMRNVEAPSTQPASSSSVGIACTRNWRMKNTPNAVTRVGRITACR